MIGIIGAGISGVTLAYFLEKAGVPYQLLEASDRVGGYIRSKRLGKYLFEFGPNSVLCDASTLQFIQQFIPENEIITANEVSKARYIFRNGKYRKLPASPPSLVFNSFFSWQTKFQIISEFYRKSTGTPNETLAQFFARRFNQEIVDYALNPFVTGIYAGNPDELLLEKTFPKLLEFEQEYGSILKGFIKNKSAERKQSVTFRNGIQELPQKIAEKISHIRYNTKVRSIRKANQKFHIQTENDAFEFDKLVVAIPAFQFADLYENTDSNFAQNLRKLNYPAMCAVHTVLKKSQTKFQFNGFGGLNPKKEGLFSAGSIWSSSVFQERCPEDEILITSFVGGMQYAESVKLSDNEIKAKLTEELQEIYKIEGKPVLQRLFRWQNAIPQYDKNILPIESKVKELERENLWICTNWVGGISITDRIYRAEELAQKLSNKS